MKTHATNNRPATSSAVPADRPRGHRLPASTIAPPAKDISRTVSVQNSRSCICCGRLGRSIVATMIRNSSASRDADQRTYRQVMKLRAPPAEPHRRNRSRKQRSRQPAWHDAHEIVCCQKMFCSKDRQCDGFKGGPEHQNPAGAGSCREPRPDEKESSNQRGDSRSYHPPSLYRHIDVSYDRGSNRGQTGACPSGSIAVAPRTNAEEYYSEVCVARLF